MRGNVHYSALCISYYNRMFNTLHNIVVFGELFSRSWLEGLAKRQKLGDYIENENSTTTRRSISI